MPDEPISDSVFNPIFVQPIYRKVVFLVRIIEHIIKKVDDVRELTNLNFIDNVLSSANDLFALLLGKFLALVRGE